MRAPSARYIEAEQFELFPEAQTAKAIHFAFIVKGDEQDGTTTLVVDGTKTKTPEP